MGSFVTVWMRELSEEEMTFVDKAKKVLGNMDPHDAELLTARLREAMGVGKMDGASNDFVRTTPMGAVDDGAGSDQVRYAPWAVASAEKKIKEVKAKVAQDLERQRDIRERAVAMKKRWKAKQAKERARLEEQTI